MPNIIFAENAWNDYLFWQSNDKNSLRKINQLLKDISRNPYDGLGKPEELKGDLSGKWSRRINNEDRIVYSISSEGIILYSCKGHYSN